MLSRNARAQPYLASCAPQKHKEATAHMLRRGGTCGGGRALTAAAFRPRLCCCCCALHTTKLRARVWARLEAELATKAGCLSCTEMDIAAMPPCEQRAAARGEWDRTSRG
jgi:hypothetical protein